MIKSNGVLVRHGVNVVLTVLISDVAAGISGMNAEMRIRKKGNFLLQEFPFFISM